MLRYWTVDGVRGVVGDLVQPRVDQARNLGHVIAITLHLFLGVRVMDLLPNRNRAMMDLALLMANGEVGHHGIRALSPVQVVHIHVHEVVTVHRLIMVEVNVQVLLLIHNPAIHILARYTVYGQAGDHGNRATSPAEEGKRIERELAQTLLHNTEEILAVVIPSISNPAIHILAPSMEIGVNGVIGRNVINPVVLAFKTAHERALTLLHNMVEIIALVMMLKEVFAMSTRVQTCVILPRKRVIARVFQ